MGENRTAKDRNRATVATMKAAIDEAVHHKGEVEPDVPGLPIDLLDELTSSLFASEPNAAAPAEAAFVLLAMCLEEGRVLDLTSGRRLKGDRTNSERLSDHLATYNIPATQGALQSSTYRSGYVAAQARNPALSRFCVWASEPDRTLEDLRGMFTILAHRFAQLEMAFPPLPVLNASAFTFVRTRELIEDLLNQGSQGAYEQYLVAAMTNQAVSAVHPAWTAKTKSVKAPDAGTRSPADVQVMRRNTTVHALEVSGADWVTKLRQIPTAASAASLTEVTVIAPTSGANAEQLARELADAGIPDGIDVAVVDLLPYLDSMSARLSSVGRAAAVRQVYDWLVLWGRTRPDLVQHLVSSIEARGLAGEREDPLEPTVAEAVAKLRNVADLDDDPVVEVGREDLLGVISWLESQQ